MYQFLKLRTISALFPAIEYLVISITLLLKIFCRTNCDLSTLCQLCRAISLASSRSGEQQNFDGSEVEIFTWNDALRNSTMEFQHRSYNLLTCNCHSFVANNLNRLGFGGGRWNVVSLAVLILFKGRWVDTGAAVKSLLPFLIVFPLGLALGGWTFLECWGMIVILLVGWFLFGSYCFKGLIQL